MGAANVIGIRLAAAPADVAPDALETIFERVARVCPRPAEPLEVTAVLESLGYTDAVIREITPQPDSRSLGAILFDALRAADLQQDAALPPPPNPREDLRVLLQTFSLSSIYALPWIVTYVLQRWHPEVLQVPQEAAAPLTLGLIFSLIVSGGFVQCMARKGTFYTGLGQPALGAEVGVRIWHCGVGVLVITSFAGVAMSWYFDLFEVRYAALGAASYLLLGSLWLTCGFLWLEGRLWHVPATFGGAALAFMATRGAGGSSLEAQLTAGAAALMIALSLMGLALYRHRGGVTRRLALPRFAMLSRALAPYFCYGTGYFAFVFADRIAAGSAVPTASGVQFSVDAHYQAGMDTALLCFLVSMGAVEFLNYRFIHFWQREAAAWGLEAADAFRTRVREQCARSWLLVSVCFAVTAALVSLLPSVRETLRDPLAVRVLVFGLAGYLLLELALFNALVLFSVNAPNPVLRALLAGFVVNAGGGYVLSHAFGPVLAAAAMCVGAGVFLWRSDRALGIALDRPGFGCYVA